MERTDFQKRLGPQRVLKPLNGQPIEIFKIGNHYYANLFVSDNHVYAASESDDKAETIGFITLKNGELFKESMLSTHQIKVLEVKPYSAVGEVV